MTKFKQISPWLILVMVILWVTLTESPYQKGGTSPMFSLAIPLFVLLIAILIGLRHDAFILFERFVASIVIGLMTLFFVSIAITPFIVDYFYSDKTWFLWETKHRLFINAIYYGLNVAFVTVLIHLYFKLRRQITRNKTNTISIL